MKKIDYTRFPIKEIPVKVEEVLNGFIYFFWIWL